MEPALSPPSLIPPSPSPNHPPISPNREIYWKTSWDDIPVVTDSLIVPSQTSDLEDLDADSLYVADTPDREIYWNKSWDDKPDSSWEIDSVSTAVPESPLTELDLFPTVAPESPATKRRKRRPVEDEEWFKSLLVMLLPGMADLL